MSVSKVLVDSWKRRKNKLGKFSVPCVITDRWLRFSKKSDSTNAGQVFWVDVMTDVSGSEKKICTLAITKEDIKHAFENIDL